MAAVCNISSIYLYRLTTQSHFFLPHSSELFRAIYWVPFFKQLNVLVGGEWRILLVGENSGARKLRHALKVALLKQRQVSGKSYDLPPFHRQEFINTRAIKGGGS